MVVFTCNHCGETLQKPKVAKHYEFRCRTTPFLTCVDCMKDFREEYVTHTKCISEAERYGGQDYVAKSTTNKGERKQQEWICVVSNLLNSTMNLSSEEKNFLNILSKYENIPRKKAKFLNFVRNAMGNRITARIVESVWSKMETTHKESQESTKQIPKQDAMQIPQQDDGNVTPKCQSEKSDNSLDNQENIIENQNNENICKENNSPAKRNNKNEVCQNGNHTDEKHKKSKKRKSRDTEIPQGDQPVAKISKTSNFSLQTNGNESDNSAFDWKQNILNIVQAKKDEIALKKLQSKIFKRYARRISDSHDVQNLTVEEHEKATIKFNKALKKLKKSSVICVSEDTVKLA